MSFLSAARVVVVALLLCESLLWNTTARAADAPRPNLLFLLTDDQRFDALGCAGNPLIHTPNIDALAATGVRFTHHFVTTAICNCSRASIFTGQYERRHGIVDFKTPLTPEQWSRTYPALLRQAGYRTGFTGKFGVGDAAYIAAKKADFDFFRGRPGQGGALFIDPKDPTHTHTTARLGQDALDFLDGCTPDKPFFLQVSFNSPHARDGKPREFQPDLRDESLYASDTIPVPPTASDEYFQKLPDFVKKSEGRTRWQRRFATPEMFQKTMRDYYRLVSGIDREVGRIVARLREKGLADNTIIVFTSDNGWFAGERGMADKWLMYEEAIRVPLIIVGPRLAPTVRGRTMDAMTLNIDLAPTMLHWAGVSVPPQMQGRSLVPLLEGEAQVDWRTSFFYEHHYGPKIIPPSEGVRTQRWAYIRWIAPNPVTEELYDLQADPLEKDNLATDPKYAIVMQEMRDAWRRMGDAAK
jgi:arylsulfatase A-like enzyme